MNAAGATLACRQMFVYLCLFICVLLISSRGGVSRCEQGHLEDDEEDQDAAAQLVLVTPGLDSISVVHH